MEDSLSCSPDSLVNPLDSVDTALTELTSKLIPGFAQKVATSTLSDVEQATAEVVCQALTEQLGDAPRQILLGKMAILLASRFKEAQGEIEMLQLKVRTADAHARELEQENKDYRAQVRTLKAVEDKALATQKVAELEQTIHDCDHKMADLVDKFEQVSVCLNDSKGDLATAREELVDLNAKLKAYEKAQMTSQGHQQELRRQLNAACSEREEALRLQKRAELELRAIKKEMEYSAQLGLTSSETREAAPHNQHRDPKFQQHPTPPAGHAPCPEPWFRESPMQGREASTPRSCLAPNSRTWLIPTDRDLDKIA